MKKNHKFLSSTKNDAHRRKLVPFSASRCKTECNTADMSRRFALAEISYIFNCEQPVVVSGHYHCDYACSMYDILFLVGHSEVRVLAMCTF